MFVGTQVCNLHTVFWYYGVEEMSDVIFTDMTTDLDILCSIIEGSIISGASGSVMTILIDRPIRNNLSNLIGPGFIEDYTKAQFIDIADVIFTSMTTDTDLPAGASGAWGALQTRSGELLNGIIHWSFDDFVSELKTQPDTEIEYISGSGIPPYVVSGSDDPNAGGVGRSAEDFRFYDGGGDLRIQEFALPNQWNEINWQSDGGHGSTLDILIAMFL